MHPRSLPQMTPRALFPYPSQPVPGHIPSSPPVAALSAIYSHLLALSPSFPSHPVLSVEPTRIFDSLLDLEVLYHSLWGRVVLSRVVRRRGLMRVGRAVRRL